MDVWVIVFMVLLYAFFIPRTLQVKIKYLNIWGGLGGSVNLPCPLNPEVYGEQPVLTLWFKASNTEAFYSFDTRSTKFPYGKSWADEEVMGHRASFHADNSVVPYLTLKPVKEDDHGVFTCRVDYKISPSTHVKVNLSVAIPPGVPEIYWQGKLVSSTLGPLSENERVELTCKTEGGFPSPRMTWWRQGHMLESDTEEVRDGLITSATITIVAIRSMYEIPFVCQARSQHPDQSLAKPKTTAVTVDITLPPLTVDLFGAKGPTEEGMTINPYCRSSGSHPPAELIWYLDGRRLSHVNRTVNMQQMIEENGNVSSTTFSLTLSKEDDGAKLSCHAINRNIVSAPLIDFVILNVFYKPMVKLRLGKSLDPSNLKEGQDAFFDCQVSSNPPHHRLEWFHNGKSIILDNKGVIVSGSSLALQKLKKSHSGTYSCSVENLEGQVSSNVVSLSIKYSPKCANDSDETQGATKGRYSTILCRVDALPAKNLNFSWTHLLPSGEEVALSMQNITNEGSTSQITIFPRRMNDFGPYLCKATNSIGIQQNPCVIQLVTEGPPEPPVNCSSNSFQDGLRISCKEGFHGGFPPKFLLQAWQKQILVANITNDFPEWTLQELKTGESIKIKLQSLNSKGVSASLLFDIHSPVANLQATTESTDDNRDFSLIAGVLMGTLFMAICFLIVIVIVVHKTKFRKRSSNQSTQETLLNQHSSTEGFSHTTRTRSQDGTMSDGTDGLSFSSSDSYGSSLDSSAHVVSLLTDSLRTGLPPKQLSKSVPNSLGSHGLTIVNQIGAKTRKSKRKKAASNLGLEGESILVEKSKPIPKLRLKKCPDPPSFLDGEIQKRDSFHLIDYPVTPQLNRTNTSETHGMAVDDTNSGTRSKVKRKRGLSESRRKNKPKDTLVPKKPTVCKVIKNNNLSKCDTIQKSELCRDFSYGFPRDTVTSGVSYYNRTISSGFNFISSYPSKFSTYHARNSQKKLSNIGGKDSSHNVITKVPTIQKRKNLKTISSTTRVQTDDQRESMV